MENQLRANQRPAPLVPRIARQGKGPMRALRLPAGKTQENRKKTTGMLPANRS